MWPLPGLALENFPHVLCKWRDSGMQWRQRRKTGDTWIPEWPRAAEPLWSLTSTRLWCDWEIISCYVWCRHRNELPWLPQTRWVWILPRLLLSYLICVSAWVSIFLRILQIYPQTSQMSDHQPRVWYHAGAQEMERPPTLWPHLCLSPRISGRGLCLVPGHRIWLIHEYLALRFN